jgi:hypothetical protein
MKKLLAACLLLAASAFSLGQTISVNGGSIQGTISDPSGAAIPGATVVIINPDTGYTHTLKTDSAGFYSLGPLNPGNYTINISAPSFQHLKVTTVVRTGTATSGSEHLTVGSQNETVEVNAGALQINTDQAGVSDVITKQQIEALPVNGRNFLDLAQIEPGVILQSGESFDPTKAGYSAISLDGVSGRSTRILLDGQDITDENVGTTIFNVSTGAISEFQLNRSTQDVSGDVTSTGQVLVSTNSGTNTFHGQLFYNFQDHRALFARAENGQDPQFQRNQFGGSVGGPIIKDHLFFFANAERIKQDSSSVSPVSTGPGSLFSAIEAQFPLIPTPYRLTYSTGRLDYNGGPFGGHYFARISYDVDSVSSNFGDGYWTYANRDNTPGYAFGADFQAGRTTHSFRGSYEKFHNLIVDTTAGSHSVYDAIPGLAFYYTAQHLYSGPNDNAPQASFQTDKQFRYDGSLTKGAHTIRWGYSLNRIAVGGFASFFGNGPRVTLDSSTLLTGSVSADNPFGYGCDAVVGAAPCPDDPIKGYNTRLVYLGNGQGSFTEKPAFGLPGSGQFDWRQAAYLQDSWKVTPGFTLTAGLRWSIDTGRANQDLNPILCSDVDTSSVTAPCSGSSDLFAQWNPTFTGKVHTPSANFGPQLGFNYSPGNHKMSIHGGAGIFYENDVFNNTLNSRGPLLKSGAFNIYPPLCRTAGTTTVTFADGSQVSSINGTSISDLCNSPLSVTAPDWLALQAEYQASAKANPTSPNSSYIGETLNVSNVYAPTYRTPYAEQYNLGVERELFRGAILKVDYIHNSTLKIGLNLDQNHVGAARYLNVANAQAAIAATLSACGVASISDALTACPGLDTDPTTGVVSGATLSDFAGNGLDSGQQYTGGYPGSYYGVTPAAFAGANPALGQGNFTVPIGRSGYDALQFVYREVTAHPVRGIDDLNLQVSYNLSRIISDTNSNAGGSDQFFTGNTWDNDNPSAYMGRNSLDHLNQLSLGGTFTVKHGPRVALTGAFRSASPTNLTLDPGSETGGIFQSDVTGDGTIGDLAPGTLPGDYMHRIKSGDLSPYIKNFNSTLAGTLTPAGKALVSAGLFTPGQLSTIGATIQPIADLPQATALNNPMVRSVDMSFSYPIHLNRIREGLSLEPIIAFYNVFNLANYGQPGLGTLLTQDDAGGAVNANGGYLTGPNNYSVLNSVRDQRGSGTFDQGAARSTEFQLRLNF